MPSLLTPIVAFKCSVCEKYKGNRHKETEMVILDSPTYDPVTQTYTYPETSQSYFVCDTCSEEIAQSHALEGDYAAILERFANESMEDDYMSTEWDGYIGRFGNWLYFSDSQGFKTAEEFKSVQDAEKRFDEIYADGMGYSDEDFTVSFDRGEYSVYQNHKRLFTHERESRCLAWISLEMRRTGFYPNVWREHERGGLSLVKNVW